ncbi:MAG: hypothetical protein ABEJ58_03230 [Halodesulfurarchaeum sp.]
MPLIDTLISLVGSDERMARNDRQAPNYICAACGTRFEELHRECPECDGLVVPQELAENGSPYTI